MDIIKANECLRHQYGPPRKSTFDNTDIKVIERKPTLLIVSLKEASKAQVTAYQRAMEEATKAVAESAANAAANAAAEAALEEPGRPGKSVIIGPPSPQQDVKVGSRFITGAKPSSYWLEQ